MSRTNILKQSVEPIKGCLPSPVVSPRTFEVDTPKEAPPTWPGSFLVRPEIIDSAINDAHVLRAGRFSKLSSTHFLICGKLSDSGRLAQLSKPLQSPALH